MVPFAPRRATCLGAILATAIAGCQATPASTPGTRLAFGAYTTDQTPQPVAVAAAVPAEVPAPAPVTPVSVPSAAPAVVAASTGSAGPSHHGAAAPTGTLTVDLSALVPAAPAAQRRVLSTVSDIDRLEVTVAVFGQPDRVLTVTGAELQGGKKAITFQGLPTGSCTVTIRAYDVTNKEIGASARLASIAAAKETKADLYTFIVPDDGSGYTYATQRLFFGVNLQAAPPAQAADGTGPVAGTVVDTFNAALMPGPPYVMGVNALYADNAGHLYIRASYPLSPTNLARWSNSVSEVSTADGARGRNFNVSFGLPFPAGMVYDPVRKTMVIAKAFSGTNNLPTTADYVDGPRANALSINAAGDLYYVVNGKVYRKSDGVATPLAFVAHSVLALDSAGNVWLNHPNDGAKAASTEVRKYASDGSLLTTCTTPFPAVRLVSDGADGMWVCDRPGGQFAHIAADGTLGPALGIPALDVCVDAKRHVWVSTANQLLQLDVDGAELGRFPIRATSVAAGDGYVFARSDFTTILKIQP